MTKSTRRRKAKKTVGRKKRVTNKYRRKTMRKRQRGGMPGKEGVPAGDTGTPPQIRRETPPGAPAKHVQGLSKTKSSVAAATAVPTTGAGASASSAPLDNALGEIETPPDSSPNEPAAGYGTKSTAPSKDTTTINYKIKGFIDKYVVTIYSDDDKTHNSYTIPFRLLSDVTVDG